MHGTDYNDLDEDAGEDRGPRRAWPRAYAVHLAKILRASTPTRPRSDPGPPDRPASCGSPVRRAFHPSGVLRARSPRSCVVTMADDETTEDQDHEDQRSEGETRGQRRKSDKARASRAPRRRQRRRRPPRRPDPRLAAVRRVVVGAGRRRSRTPATGSSPTTAAGSAVRPRRQLRLRRARRRPRQRAHRPRPDRRHPGRLLDGWRRGRPLRLAARRRPAALRRLRGRDPAVPPEERRQPGRPADQDAAGGMRQGLEDDRDAFFDEFIDAFFQRRRRLKVDEEQRQEALALCQQSDQEAALGCMDAFGTPTSATTCRSHRARRW